VHLAFAEGPLGQQGALGIIPLLGAEVLDPFLPVLPEIVKPQAIFLGVGHIDEGVFELDPLGWINQTFENGVLHALAAILTEFGYVSKPTLTGGSLGVHVVSNQYHHRSYFLSPEKRRVAFQITA